MKYIIEHLDGRLYKWSLLEYTHISQIVGKSNLIFTNIKSPTAKTKLEKLGLVEKDSIINISKKKLVGKKLCVLDPFAKSELSKNDNFDYLVLGGILGDEPMQKRTEIELSNNVECKTRHLGKKQMSTDTACYVAKYITDGGDFKDLNFVDGLDITINEYESVELPFRYVTQNGKVKHPPGLIEFLKKRRSF